MGLYAVLWGKNKEMKPMIMSAAIEDTASRKLYHGDDDDKMVKMKDDLELQLNPTSNGNHNVTTGDHQEKRNETKSSCNPTPY